MNSECIFWQFEDCGGGEGKERWEWEGREGEPPNFDENKAKNKKDGMCQRSSYHHRA